MPTTADAAVHGIRFAAGSKQSETLKADLVVDASGRGALTLALLDALGWERPDVGVLPQRDFGLSLLCASRPLIEVVLRHRAEAIANVALRPECRVTEIVPATADAAVHGIRFDAGSKRPETLEADLEVTEIGVDLSYATAVVQIPSNAPPDWKLVLTQPDPPVLAANAVLVPMEGGRWIISIADRSATARLETWDSFLEASRSLITPTLYQRGRRQVRDRSRRESEPSFYIAHDMQHEGYPVRVRIEQVIARKRRRSEAGETFFGAPGASAGDQKTVTGCLLRR